MRQVFGRWLLDHTAAVPPARLPMDPALACHALDLQLSDLRAIT